MYCPLRILAALALAFALTLGLTPRRVMAGDWNLIVLSTADSEGQLLPHPGENGRPVGGYARLATAIAAMKAEYPDKILTLSAGEDLIGPHYELFEGEPAFTAMRLMGYDAGTLANHEFDMGDAFLARALRHCSFPVVEANLTVSPGTPLAGLFKPWLLLTRNGLKIGVFGLANAALPTISKPGPAVSVDGDYAAVARETARSLRSQGADLVIALAQTGLIAAQALAREVPEIDVICVGDSDLTVERGRELIRHPDGKIAVVTQTGQKGAYLGTLKLRVENKRIADYFWNLAPVDESLAPDPKVQALAEEFEAKLPKDEVVAAAAAPIDLRKTTLRTAEAPVGDFVCDALRREFKTDAALYNGGGIRGDRMLPQGAVRASDIREMFPFGDDVIILKIKGRALYEAFELAAAALPESSGAFLQVSGLRAILDPLKPPMRLAKNASGDVTGAAFPGSRVQRLELCGGSGDCAPLDPEAELTVAVSAFLAGGGDGYVMFRDLPKTDTGVKVADAIIKVMREEKTLAPKTDGRIAILGR